MRVLPANRRESQRRARRHRSVRRILGAGSCAALAAALLCWLTIAPYRGDLARYPSSTVIRDAGGEILRTSLNRHDAVCLPVTIEQTGDWAAKAVVAAEDKRFFQHRGVDLRAMLRAALQNLICRRIVSGASTISTLVVKLTTCRPRTVRTKLIEARHALQLERRLKKQRILEQYLNRAPFGGNLTGLEAASRRYFAKSSRDLSLAEAALLAGLPQSPARLRPDRHPQAAIRRRGYVLGRMWQCGYISSLEFQAALRAPVQLRTIQPAGMAPHFCDWLLQRHPDRHDLHSTLDIGIQACALQVLRQQLDKLRAYGVRGGAVVVLEVATGAVRAMVGSPDFAAGPAGQVNCATARRSPGSALKPFIFALALDHGLCTPGTVVPDVPGQFAGYEPRNFERCYHGPVTVRRALVNSLNVPAILYTRELGPANVLECLRSLGCTTLDKPAAHYGLGLAVGTCEVTLLELAGAYACLARLGRYKTVRSLGHEPGPDDRRVFSEAACYLLADMLGGDERALQQSGHIADVRHVRIAWKTGTSAGCRDAWTIGYNPEYVVGVWIGNPDGRGTPALIGAKAAAPVVMNLFGSLYPAGTAPWFARPRALARRQICASSGCLPGPHCPARIEDDFIPGLSANAVCTVHRGGTCGNSEVRPPAVAAYLRTHGMTERTGPHGPDAAPAQVSGPRRLQIVSPAADTEYRLIEGIPVKSQGIKLAAVSDMPATLHWFVDGVLWQKTTSDEPAFWPLRRGTHTIVCSAANGQSDRAVIRVR